MPVFESTEKMYEVLGGLFTELMANDEIRQKAMETGLTVCFNITEPNGQIWLSPEEGGQVVCGSADLTPSVTMTLSGDSCHDFWLKKLNLPVAIAKRKIKTKGAINKVLKLLPMLKPAYEMYPDIARKHNLPV